MIDRLIVYFDYKSPYAYLAKDPARGLAAEFGLAIEWRPYTLRIPEYLGSLDNRNDHQWRRVRYSYADCRRIANERGLTVLGPQRIFDSRVGHIGALYAQAHGVFDAYHDLVFERFFKRQLDIDVVDEVQAALAEAGAPGLEDFPAFVDGEGDVLYTNMLDEAEAAGIFGVPTFVVGDEFYWGGDRIEMTRRALAAALYPAGTRKPTG